MKQKWKKLEIKMLDMLFWKIAYAKTSCSENPLISWYKK